MSHIENPTAYWNAVDARIKARAWEKKRREWEQANPEAAALVKDLWSPDWNPEVEEWQQDGSHNVLHVLTVQERKSLLRRAGWLREGYEKWGSLTENQTAKLLEIAEEVRTKVSRWDAEEAERIANALPWEAGRQDAEVTLVSAKLKRQPSFNPYDRYEDLVWKGVFQREDGSRVWCTIPSKLVDECGWREEDAMAKILRGAKLVLTVTVEPKDGEPTFAFGKRPTILKKNEGRTELPNLPADEED